MTDDKPYLTSPDASAFQAVADFCYAKAAHLVAQNQPVAPAVLAGVIEDRRFRVLSAGILSGNPEGARINPLSLLEVLVHQPRIDFAVHTTEAWYVQGHRGEAFEGSLADHPRREEAVIFNILSKDCQAVVINPLRRDPLRLERGAVDFSSTLRGRMARERPAN